MHLENQNFSVCFLTLTSVLIARIRKTQKNNAIKIRGIPESGTTCADPDLVYISGELTAFQVLFPEKLDGKLKHAENKERQTHTETDKRLGQINNKIFLASNKCLGI